VVEIHRVGAYVVRIYSNEPRFEEPHVHVWRAGTWVKISIPDETKTARLLRMSRKQMAPAHVIEAVRLVEEHASSYLAEYRRIWQKRYGKKTD
jgi:hypothetical protein